MLDTFSDRIQFFIITHNKHTMTRAAKLLGITMENGVSQLVPVKLKGTALEK
jgi:chromosome segregation protein